MATLPVATDRFEAERKGFAAKAAMLAKLQPTEENAAQALIWDTPAKLFLKQAEETRVKLKEPMLETIRRHDKFWNDTMAPAKAVRAQYARLSAGWERIRQARLAEERRLDEARLLQEQERQRKAEADHLLDIAASTGDEFALQAAIEAENAPLVPIVSSVDENEGKVPGSSVTLKKTGKIVDVRVFLRWLTDYASLVDLVELKVDPAEVGPALKINQSAVDDKLNRGIEIPGVQVMERAITRNVSR